MNPDVSGMPDIASLKTFNFGEVFAGIEQGKLAGGVLTAAGILVFLRCNW